MEKNRAIGLFIVRVVLGLIFLMEGYGKVFSLGLQKVYESFFEPTYAGILPESVTYFTAYYTSYVELFGGLLLLIGWQRDAALYALGSVLIVVSFGHGLVEPIWDLSHVFYRLVLLVALLVLPEQWDVYTLDRALKKRRPSK